VVKIWIRLNLGTRLNIPDDPLYWYKKYEELATPRIVDGMKLIFECKYLLHFESKIGKVTASIVDT
jgi:hypothetical protein